MNLDREVLTCVDELNEQRELVAETLIVRLAYELALKFVYEIVELLACVLAVGNYCLVAWHA